MTESSLAKGLAAACFAVLSCVSAANAQTSVSTYHNDNLRTGWNSSETTLTQSAVGGGSFGQLFSVPLDDQVDAQPLVATNVTINGQQHSTVVYIATEHNSVYAIDPTSGQVLLQTNLGSPVPYPLGCGNNGPNVGVNSTPVIDAVNGILYVIAYTNDGPTFRIHALSLSTLADTVTPVVVTASGMLTNGTTYQFNPSVSRQRAAVLLSNNTVYAGFASFCDFAANQSRGWVLGWQAGTLTPLAANKLANTRASSQDNFFLTSVWMSGYGIAANAAGSVFFVTGNSDYSGNSYNKVTNISESAAQMSPDLSTLQGLFTPSNYVYLEEVDGDFGSGGLMLLPPQPARHPDLAAAAGKDGNLYLLNADRMRRVMDSHQIGGCWCGPSYFQGSDGVGRVVSSGGNTVGVWAVTGRRPTLALKTQWGGVANGQNGGFFTSVSSNGTSAGSAVVWAVGRPTDGNPANIFLYAVNPDTGQNLFTGLAGQWPNTGGDSNTVPVAANGQVYVASNQMLTIFGLGGHHSASLPPVKRTDMRPPLPAGHHEVYGMVASMKGSTIVMTRRSGGPLRVDTTDARKGFRYAVPGVGHAMVARGIYTPAGALDADTVLHAVDHSAMWPADR